MTDRTNVVSPSLYWYAVGLAILVVGIAVARWLMNGGPSDTAEIVPVRGNGQVRLEKPGAYSLYITMGASRRMDASAERAWQDSKTATVVVRSKRDGASLALRDVYETVSIQNSRMARLVEFDVVTAGDFQVQISPSLNALNPVIRPSATLDELGQDIQGAVVQVLAGLAIGSLATIAAGTIFAVVGLLRRKNRKQLAK